jgi:hypothetical protein
MGFIVLKDGGTIKARYAIHRRRNKKFLILKKAQKKRVSRIRIKAFINVPILLEE